MPQTMDRETARVEAFSDGIFGIAMTLLILEFRVPPLPQGAEDGRRQLMLGLLHLWPSGVAFLLSFGTILIMWVNHHGLFKHAHGADNRLLFANGFLMLIVTFVPVSISYNLLLWSVVANRRHDAAWSEATIARVKKAYRMGLWAYLIATATAMFWPYLGVAIRFSLWPLWAMLRYYERQMK